MLAQLSEESGVHIIASTGFHRKRYYGPDPALWRLSADEAADYFLAEIRQGLRETRDKERPPIRPGLIKIAAEATLAETPRPLLEAATTAARVSGYAMEVHTERGTAVEDLLDFFLAHDLPPSQLVFCHVDKRPDVGLHQELAEAGVMLEYDTFFRPKYNPEQNLWPLIRRMVDAGWGEMLALATDMADSGMWRSFGGEPGLAAFLTTIQPRLQEMGISEKLTKQLLGGNIIGRLQLPVASGRKSNERKTV
jgi:phosphotriesterase-related protein